jgi:hypothetical protein
MFELPAIVLLLRQFGRERDRHMRHALGSEERFERVFGFFKGRVLIRTECRLDSQLDSVALASYELKPAPPLLPRRSR